MITPEMTAPYVLGLLKCVRYETKHWLDRVPVLSGAKVSIIYGFGKTTRPKNFAGILQRQNDTPRQKFRSALRRPSTRPDGHRAFLRKPPPHPPPEKARPYPSQWSLSPKNPVRAGGHAHRPIPAIHDNPSNRLPGRPPQARPDRLWQRFYRLRSPDRPFRTFRPDRTSHL